MKLKLVFHSHVNLPKGKWGMVHCWTWLHEYSRFPNRSQTTYCYALTKIRDIPSRGCNSSYIIMWVNMHASIYLYIYMYHQYCTDMNRMLQYKTSPQLYSQVGCKPSLSRSHLRLSSTSFETTPRTLPGFRTRLEWICRIPSGKLLHSELENHHLE